MASGSKAHAVTTGLAMFSMFFGAGNVVFPLALGHVAHDQSIFAIMGLLLTGVLMPFMGLIAMSLFDGNYHNFFGRMGKVPGFIMMILPLALIGPLGAIPRTITLSFNTIKDYVPSVPLVLFSAISCLIIYGFTIKKSRIVDLIGKFLTPFLLVSLGLIVVLGFMYAPGIPAISDLTNIQAFNLGLLEGYNTMDLPGALFFSSVVLAGLKLHMSKEDAENPKAILKPLFISSFIGASLLGIVYSGFCLVSSYYAEVTVGVPTENLIGFLANEILGPYGGVVACTAVSLACLTTAIALTAVFADFIHEELFPNHVSYPVALLITLGISFGLSTLDFSGIAAFVGPIMKILYPGLIIMSVLNLFHKVKGIQLIKTPVYSSIIIAAVAAYAL